MTSIRFEPKTTFMCLYTEHRCMYNLLDHWLIYVCFFLFSCILFCRVLDGKYAIAFYQEKWNTDKKKKKKIYHGSIYLDAELDTCYVLRQQYYVILLIKFGLRDNWFFWMLFVTKK